MLLFTDQFSFCLIIKSVWSKTIYGSSDNHDKDVCKRDPRSKQWSVCKMNHSNNATTIVNTIPELVKSVKSFQLIRVPFNFDTFFIVSTINTSVLIIFETKQCSCEAKMVTFSVVLDVSNFIFFNGYWSLTFNVTWRTIEDVSYHI